MAITDPRTGESLQHVPLGAGDIAVADRGSCHPEAIIQRVPRGADVVLRRNPHHLPLCQREGVPLDWVAALRRQVPTSVCTLPVLLGGPAGPARVEAWVHAYRLPPAEANRARQMCRKRKSKQEHRPKKSTLFWAGWVLVVTSLPPTCLPGPTVLAVYRTRWQIELAIKRWKSLLDADLWRARDGSPLADVWWHGKWLYALLLDRRLRRTLGDGWSRLEGARLATWWRPWKLLSRRGNATALPVSRPGSLGGGPRVCRCWSNAPVGDISNDSRARSRWCFMGRTPCANNHRSRRLQHDYPLTWRLCPCGARLDGQPYRLAAATGLCRAD